MREVKFRAWDKQDEEYRRVGALQWGGPSGRLGTLYAIDPVTGDSLSVFGPAGAFVIEQYTGLRDKNGVEIYEGDIVGNGARISEVTWHDWLAAFCFDSEPIYQAATINTDRSLPNWEVIGNIHENPELLESEQ